MIAKGMEISVGKFISFVKRYREVYRMHGVPMESLFHDNTEAQIPAEGLDGWLSAVGQSPMLDVGRKIRGANISACGGVLGN